MDFFKKLVMVLIGLFINSLLLAQTNSAINQTELPLQFNTGNPAPYGLPSTFITIGNKTIPILVDTGATKAEVTLSSYALGNLRVEFTGKQNCFLSYDGNHCQQEFILPEVKIGTFVLHNVKGTLMTQLWGGRDKNFLTTEASKNGVIGLGLLSKFNFLLDYPHAKLILLQPGNKPSNYPIQNWIVIPFQKNLTTKLKIDNNLLVLSWDTGAVPSIIKRMVAANFHQVMCPAKTSYGDINCRRINTTVFSTTTNQELPNTWFMLADIPAAAPFDGLIGSNFFRNNAVYFDFGEDEIYVKPLGN